MTSEIDTTAPSVVVERLPGSQMALTIEVPAARVDAAYERVLNRLAQRARIEGFRPGKAPRNMVEARIGPDGMREEVVELLAPEVVSSVLIERDIPAISRPRVEVVEIDRGRPGRFIARVDVMPEVTLPDLGSLSSRRQTTEVTDELVERRISELRDRTAEITPVEREVRLGDVIVVDLDVLVDGEEVAGERRRAMEAEVREGVLIPELLAILPGTNVGETRETAITLPGDHPEPGLGGREAVLRMTVQGVKEKRLPELDDEVAKQLSDGRHETVGAFREGVRAELVEQAARMDGLAFEQSLVKEVVEGSTVEVPHSLIDREVERRLQELERQLSRQGIKLDLFLKYSNVTIDQWAEREHPEAEARLAVDLVLEEVARREGLDPTDAELEAHMREESAADPDLADRVDEVLASESARDYFRHRLVRLRTLERLAALASGSASPAAPKIGEAGSQEVAGKAAGGNESGG